MKNLPSSLRSRHDQPSKQALADAAAQLPKDCSWDDVMYTLYVRQKIQQELNDANQNKVVVHEVVFEEFARSDTSLIDASGG